MDKEKLEIVYISKSYQDYIKPFCSEHQLLDKGDRQRPFLGVVLTGFNGYDYFVPLTSAERSSKQNEQIDVFAINKGKNGTLNFNLMMPVPQSDVITFEISKLPKCPSRDMFEAQRRHIIRQSKKIISSAAEVYLRSIYAPNNNLAKRCNDFVFLEEKLKYWNEHKEEIINKKSEKSKEDKKDVPSSEDYKKTSIYKQAVEKYGKRVADKMVADVLAKALSQEKNESKAGDAKTVKKQPVSSTASNSKSAEKKKPAKTSKKPTVEKGTVTTVTIKSSPAKGK